MPPLSASARARLPASAFAYVDAQGRRRLPIHDARRDALDRLERPGGNRALAVDRLAQRVDDAPQQFLADRHRNDAAGALHHVAFFDFPELAQQHGADAVLFEVQRDAEHAVRELEHLARHGILDAVHTGNPVSDRHDTADFGDIDVDGVASDLLANDFGDFLGFDVHERSYRLSTSRSLIFSSCRVTLAS